jgi:tetratricopeptide (TPR) repeat protein
MKNTDESPKSIWKKSWNLPGSFFGWLVLVTGLAFVVSLLAVIILDQWQWRADWGIVIAGTVGGLMVALLLLFIRWLCCWRNLRRFLLSLACFAVLIALFYAEEDWRGWHAWQKFKHEWEAKGEKFDFASFVPPAVPDEKNFALTPIVFTSYGSMLTRDGKVIPYEQRDKNFINRLEMDVSHNYDSPTNGSGYWAEGTETDLKLWQQYYRTLSETTNVFPVAQQPQTPAADVLLALSKYDSAIEELRQASQMPYSRFPINYDVDHPFDALLSHLATLKRCTQVLQLRAIAELENDQSEKSLADVKLMLHLADSIRSEPFLISHLVRFAVVEITLQPIWEGLVEHKWSDAQLVELEGELGKLDFLANFEFSIRGERAGGIGVVDYIRRHRNYRELVRLFFETGDDDNSNNWEDHIKALGFYLMPSGWFYQNELAIAQIHQQWFLPMVDVKQQLVSPEIARQSDEFMKSLGSTPQNVFARMLLPSFGAATRKSCREQISVDLAQVACALERYRLARGEYPESLDVLAPQFIAKLPHDIINGQPLHYRRTSDGQFVLYSVGWNEKDDGGVVGYETPSSIMPSFELGDWVWRYPTK